jgi:hypothetical protein
MSSFFESLVVALQDPILIAMMCLANCLTLLLFSKRALRERHRIDFLEDAMFNMPRRDFIFVIMDNKSFGFRWTRGTNDND